MVRAHWNGAPIVESDGTAVIDGRHSVDRLVRRAGSGARQMTAGGVV
ncbi:MAG: hypothetical protein M3508_10390 [Actinomycetota bacterium]|nr:hypothetical protein [Actinomycetota bacterium]